MLIFLGMLKEGISINQQELATVLGKVVAAASNLELKSFDTIEIGKKSYLYGNFEKIIIISEYLDKESPPNEFLIQLNRSFLAKYAELLENYSKSDIPKFKPFIENIKAVLDQLEEKSPVESKLEEKPAPSVPIIEIPKKVEIGKEMIIKPMKRDAYPEGIPDYKRDEVLWNESEMVKNEYVAEFVEGMISHVQVFLSISLTHHYQLFIDFSDYPSKPKINIGKGLAEELGKSLDELLYFYRNWDTKIPAHIIELVREFEAVLMKYKAKGKLSATDEMPETALPELEPLPELPPLEEEAKEEVSPPEKLREAENPENKSTQNNSE